MKKLVKWWHSRVGYFMFKLRIYCHATPQIRYALFIGPNSKYFKYVGLKPMHSYN